MTPNIPLCAVHAGEVALGNCPRCGAFVCQRCVVDGSGLTCESCRARGVHEVTELTPWERRDELGLVSGFWLTTRAALVDPKKFFASVRPDGSVGDALLFGWLSSALAAPFVFLQLWLTLTTMKAPLKQVLEQLAKQGSDIALPDFSPASVAALFAFPSVALFPLSLIMGVATIHVGLLLFGAGARGFGASMRAMSYVYATQIPIAILSVVPGVGGLAGLAVYFYLAVALTKLHGSTTGRTLLGMLLVPLALGCCGAGVAGIAMFSVISRLAGQ